MVVDSHRPAPGGAIGEPFEHDRAARGDAPLGAALESAPGRAVAARRFRQRGGGARCGRRWKLLSDPRARRNSGPIYKQAAADAPSVALVSGDFFTELVAASAATFPTSSRWSRRAAPADAETWRGLQPPRPPRRCRTRDDRGRDGGVGSVKAFVEPLLQL